MNELANLILEDKAKIINHLKIQITENVIEIGRQLSEARDLCEHGEWGEWVEKNISFTQKQALQYILVYTKIGSNLTSTLNLGIEKCNLLAQLPDDVDLGEFIEDNKVENKTVKELAFLIKQSKPLSESEKILIEEKAREEGRIESFKKLNNDIEEKEMEIKHLKEIEKDSSKKINSLNKKIENLEKEKSDTNDIEKLKKQIKDLKATRETFQKEIQEIRELTQFKQLTKDFIKEISQIKYMKHFNEGEKSKVAEKILNDIIQEVSIWFFDLKKLVR